MPSTQPSEQIKEKLDIVDFIRNYVELKPAGRNFKGLCPFHSERTASFMVSRERQMWHCFGSCGAGGDIFKFLMEYENLEFREALKILAEKAGVELRKMSPEDYRQFGVLYDICAAAKDFYIESLKKFEPARAYLDKRRLKARTMEEFEIGFAPNDFDGTTTYLIQKGFKVDDIIRAGIAFKSESGKVGDRFRGRIMFPIHDHSGKVIGFSGRILPELEAKTDLGKYINSPETPIFNKSRTLYGFWKTKKAIRDSKTALLVEGQMDFLMAYQTGIPNVIATSGTALTAEHLRTLKPIAEAIIISFDNDSAGLSAAERAIDLMNQNDFSVSVLNLGDYKDPADAVVANPEFLPQAVRNAGGAMNFYFNRYLKGDLAREKKNIRAVLMKIKNLYSPIERAHWIKELTYLTGVAEGDLRDEMNKLEIEDRPPGFSIPTKPKDGGKESRAEKIAFRILQIVYGGGGLVPIENVIEFIPEKYAAAFAILTTEKENWKNLDGAAHGRINELTMTDDSEPNLDPKERLEELSELVLELQKEFYKAKIKEIQREIGILERGGDHDDLVVKIKEFDEVAKKMQNIERNGRQPYPRE